MKQIRWLIEQDIVVLAKSVKPERMRQNLDVFDFELTDDDKAQIATLNDGESQFFSHADPKMIKWMAGRTLKEKWLIDGRVIYVYVANIKPKHPSLVFE
ncbi:hypothetical protein WP50_34135 [Lactiplantibacillus plantarum]|nr:hypothetical protein WP50_34135 [Lactiplantibacillus plantarum]